MKFLHLFVLLVSVIYSQQFLLPGGGGGCGCAPQLPPLPVCLI